ncbi:MAG: glycosyltransferase family 4 protein [Planctomycetota bacterium]
MRILICWSNLSGYIAACWRALSQTPGVDLRIVAYDPRANTNAPFDRDLVDGLDVTWINGTDHASSAATLGGLIPGDFDVAVVPGWMNPSYVQLAQRFRQSGLPTCMTIDHPWQGTLRQRVSCLKNRGYVSGMAGVFVGGERARQYAYRLGARRDRVFTGLYGYDGDAFDPIGDARLASDAPPPRRFLYIGRYVPVKGLDTLTAAYAEYRQRIDDPWELHCCGSGPLKQALAGVAGLTDHGFTQPGDLRQHLQDAGALVLPSRFEPWGVVVAEAMAAGLPVITTDACGAAVELLTPWHNGLVVPAGDVQALSGALTDVSTMESTESRDMSRHAVASARSHAHRVWSRRWFHALQTIKDA